MFQWRGAADEKRTSLSAPLPQNLLVGRKRAEERKEGEEWDADMFLTH